MITIFIKAESISAFCYYAQKGNLSSGDKQYLLAEKLFKEEKYSESLSLALSVSEKSDNIETILLVNKLIGKIFENTGNYKKARTYFNKVLKTLKEIILERENLWDNRYLTLKSEILLRLGSISQKKSEIDIAIDFFNKLISVESINDEILGFKGDAYNNLSVIYFYNIEDKDINRAKDYLKKAIDIDERLNRKQSLASDYSNLASIYLQEENFKKAKSLFLKSLSFLKDDNSGKAMKYKEMLYDNLAWILYKQKNYKAYEYLDRSIVIADSLRDVEVKKAVAELELKHNVDIVKKEEEVKRLQLLGEKEKYKRNVWVISIAGGALALLLLYLTTTYKLRQQNLTLELSRTELEKETQLERLKTESQTKILNAAIDGKETERKQIAETLHDNVSALLSSANMHLQASHKQFGDGEIPLELKKTQKIILEASQKIRDLSHTLVSSVLLKFGLEYAIKEMANKYSNSTIQIHTDFDNIDRYNQEDEIKLYNIIQELINNILKHSKAKNAYVILEEKKNGHLKVMIKDDGKGFDMHNSAMKKGIGLNQIAARIQMMSGTFDIDTAIGKGTKVVIKVPFTRREEVTIA